MFQHNMMPATNSNGQTIITARAMFLNRHTEMSKYGNTVGTHPVSNWIEDTYIELLNLSPTELFDLRKKKILEIASGNSFFGAELESILGAQVTSLDINANKIKLESKNNLKNLHSSYILGLQELNDSNQGPNHSDYKDFFKAIYNNRIDTLKIHDAMISDVRKVDATKLMSIKNDSFDCCINVWMLAYLNHEKQIDAIKELIRVTRPGGVIYLYAGNNPHPYSRTTFASDFYNEAYVRLTGGKNKYKDNYNNYLIHDKVVSIINTNKFHSSNGLISDRIGDGLIKLKISDSRFDDCIIS